MATPASAPVKKRRSQPPYICDACGTMKGEGNHWFLLANDGIGDVRGASFVSWHPAGVPMASAFACGERCLHVLISRCVETGTFDPPTTRSEAANKPVPISGEETVPCIECRNPTRIDQLNCGGQCPACNAAHSRQ